VLRHAAARASARGILRILIASLMLAFGAAACSSEAATLAPAPTDAPTASAAATKAPRTPKPTKAPATAAATDEPAEPTDQPAAETATPTEEPTATPTEEPTPTPEESASPSPSPSAGNGPAAGCSGTANNRDFYASFAAGVTFDVYCAVLPKGWSVITGSYSIRKGTLQISYKGPNGARFQLDEGKFCAGKSDCPASGGDPGSAKIGGRDAALTDLGGARFAVVAQEGDLAWQISSTGMETDLLLSISQAMIAVGK
jgi:hypothetical protein